jgi:hypothetical protein
VKKQFIPLIVSTLLLLSTAPSQASVDLVGVSKFSLFDRYTNVTHTLVVNHQVGIECLALGSSPMPFDRNCTIKYSYKQTSSVSGSSSDTGFFQLALFDGANNLIGDKYLYALMSLKEKEGSFEFPLQNSTQVKIGVSSDSIYATTAISQTPINVTVISMEETKRREQEATAAREAIEKSEWAKKVITIQCLKGNSKRTISGESPKCPKGFTNPYGKFPTFQSFYYCKLFKKDLDSSSAYLEDKGRTLILDAAGKYYREPAGVSMNDLSCVLTITSAPSFVKSQINGTRSVDGMQRAKWNSMEAFWTYHPDDGLNISFRYNGK